MRFRTIPISLLLAIVPGLLGAAGSGTSGDSSAGNPDNPASPPIAENVVVTATGQPVDAATTGAGVTIVTREAIERSRAIEAADLLRSVPGLDVVEAGSAGQVTTVFLRGGDTREVLVLVDGVRVNNPYFGGYDWAHVPTSSIERIEVVRGPYSALYGTDAIGGVIQIFTRRGASETRVSASAEAGNRGARRVAAGAGGETGGVRWSADGSFYEGDGFFPNDDYENRFGTMRVDLPIGQATFGAEARILRGKLGIPFDGATPTPLRRAEADENVYMVPFEIPLGRGLSIDGALSRVEHEYRYRDPDDAYGFTFARNRSTGDAGRAVAHWSAQGHSVSAAFDWLRDEASDVSAYGVSLDGNRTTTRSWAIQDQWTIGGGFSLVAGVRRDDHSTFGGTTHPRGSLAWVSADGTIRLSAAAGSAFRAPSIGELYYPYVGNTALRPERSRSVEAGAEYRSGYGLHASIRAFGDRVESKIDYDLATNRFGNIGEARTRGVELVGGSPLGHGLDLAAEATWLDAEKRSVDPEDSSQVSYDRLPRRPNWRGSLRLGWAGGAARGELRALWVGRRPDVDPVSFGQTSDPSYLRLDFAASFPVGGGISPYLRVRNVLGRRYEEAAGFAAPRRTWVIGIDWQFR